MFYVFDVSLFDVFDVDVVNAVDGLVLDVLDYGTTYSMVMVDGR